MADITSSRLQGSYQPEYIRCRRSSSFYRGEEITLGRIMKSHSSPRITTAIPGLEKILYGGFLPGRSYLVSGGPGTGKTTLGLQYLASSSDGNGLLISLGESERNLRADAHRRCPAARP